jgi:hypothetical protein
MMHSPGRADLEKVAQAICKHSATPLETLLRHAGNALVSNRTPLQTANEELEMQEFAP